MSGSAIDAKALHFLINNFAFPLKRPGIADDDNGYNKHLIQQVLKSARRFRRQIDPEHWNAWTDVCRMLQTCLATHVEGRLSTRELTHAFQQFESGALILHVKAQNAGIFIKTAASGDYVFELFEASPCSKDALAPVGALKWSFPGSASSVPAETFQDPSFQMELAQFLDTASREFFEDFAAVTFKAGGKVVEIRDTVNPHLITSDLATILAAYGSPVNFSRTSKHVHDDVVWDTGSELPWRRSPLWLVLRVALQRLLTTSAGEEAGTLQYKVFIAFLLTDLMDQCREAFATHQVAAESLAFIRSKIARRLSKLEAHDAENISAPAASSILQTFDDFFVKSLKQTKDALGSRWTALQRQSLRHIPQVPRQVAAQDLKLHLNNSRQYLQHAILQLPRRPTFQAEDLAERPWRLESDSVTIPLLPDGEDRSNSEMRTLFALLSYETWMEKYLDDWQHKNSASDAVCRELCMSMKVYLKLGLRVYRNNPERLSRMIITAFELWRVLDVFARSLSTLLTLYPFGLTHDLFDSLHVGDATDLNRLASIENYLAHREANINTRLPGIFADPGFGCFAEKYYDTCSKLKELHSRIEHDAAIVKEAKKQQYDKLLAEYNCEIAQFRMLSHMSHGKFDDYVYKGHIYFRNCEKCILGRKTDFKRIFVYEHPLPKNLAIAKSVVFELACPVFFASWRDVVCELRDLSTSDTDQQKPWTSLPSYSALQNYHRASGGRVTLASNMKPHLDAHFGKKYFPITSFETVCVQNGLVLGYFDTTKNTWTARRSRMQDYAQHGSPIVPLHSPYNVIHKHGGQDPNATIASQGRAPIQISSHEYIALSDMLYGNTLSWLVIAREIAANNVDLDSEDAAAIVCAAMLKTGPSTEGIRLRHWPFAEYEYCRRLSQTLASKLEEIEANWRRTSCLRVVLTGFLCLFSYTTSQAIRGEAVRALERIRTTALRWARALRTEASKAPDDAVRRARKDGLLSATLLCHSTFHIHKESAHMIGLEFRDVEIFVECSIYALETGVYNMAKSPTRLRNDIMHDLALKHSLESSMHSFLFKTRALANAIDEVWPHSGGREYSSATPLRAPRDQWWEVRTLLTEDTDGVTIHFNQISGSMLVNGQALGEVPLHYRQHPVFQRFFGAMSPTAYPSDHRGMTYALGDLIQGHSIHLGFRSDEFTQKNDLVLKASKHRRTMEFVPSDVFRNPQGTELDLPLPLIEGMTHWLMTTPDYNGVVEIRPQPREWATSGSDWILDVRQSTCRRPGSTLLREQCHAFKAIAFIIEPFDDRRRLIVARNPENVVTVQLPRFDLDFFVNESAVLESKALKAIIDPNQDIGTLYGLASQLVLRDVNDASMRSTLIPMVVPTTELRGERSLVSVVDTVSNRILYGRYHVDTVMGRLTSTYEPRLVYAQALLHAATSYSLPDTLTGRTGIEEALRILNSQLAQPWRPLTDPDSFLYLQAIASLSPHRSYYPSDLRCMTKVVWRKDVREIAQHDELWTEVQRILDKHNEMVCFYTGSQKVYVSARSHEHLQARALASRRILEAAREVEGMQYVCTWEIAEAYRPRHTPTFSSDVYETTKVLSTWKPLAMALPSISRIFHEVPSIGGFHEPFDFASLAALLRIDVYQHWGSLFALAQQWTRSDRHEAIFMLAPAVAINECNMTAVRILMACAVVDEVSKIPLPSWSAYERFSEGHQPTNDSVAEMMSDACRQYPPDHRATFGNLLDPKERRRCERREAEFLANVESQSSELAQKLILQWPCEEPSVASFNAAAYTHVDVSLVGPLIENEWFRLFQNHHFNIHLRQVWSALRSASVSRLQVPLVIKADAVPGRSATARATSWPLSVPALLQRATLSTEHVADAEEDCGAAADVVPYHQEMRKQLVVGNHALQELERILRPLEASDNMIRKRYGTDLLESLRVYARSKVATRQQNRAPTVASIELLVRQQIAQVQRQQHLVSRVGSSDRRYQWLALGDLLPRATPSALLSTLSPRLAIDFPKEVRQRLWKYGLSVAALQRFKRILNCMRKGKLQQLDDELANVGHTNWSVSEQADLLLLEIDADFLIREEQYTVAQAMIRPHGGSNTALQLNCGKGKSSVIIPMIALTLANGKGLLRVIVPKPLLSQTASTLVLRLSRLLGRALYHLPFSRRSPTDKEAMRSFMNMHRQCMVQGGIILALPEHLMSFRLSAQQLLANDRHGEARLMLRTQVWLQQHTRDILDETDYVLQPKTQLVYPSNVREGGIDGAPSRWTCVQSVLSLVKRMLPDLKRRFFRSIEIVSPTSGGYPTVYLLKRDVETALLELLANKVCDGHGGILPVKARSADEREAIMAFLGPGQMSKGTIAVVNSAYGDDQNARNNLLLLRGLLVHRLLILALGKRWKVQYGVHPARAPIAVPFIAKGVPSENAEWGHIDVEIMLTCLSFYNTGLDLEAFRVCLRQALRADEPSLVLNEWISDVQNLPASFRAWESINADDEETFERKLVASAWDLPASADIYASAGPKFNAFSGTDDNKYLLPLNIVQQSLPELAGTNAEVLSYLLEARNREYCKAFNYSGRLGVEGLSNMVSSMNPPARTILDAGAMILELSNKEVAGLWLQIWQRHRAPADAAVFFDERDRIMVLYPDRRLEPLAVSPFLENMSNCLAYLDQIHTRGTDLKLPADARAALTLSVGLMKDHVVQAAMRLRQLGTTQSVRFVAGREVDVMIRDHCKKPDHARLDSHDVISWLLEQTCDTIESLQPLYISQGREYCARTQAAIDFPEAATSSEQRLAYLNKVHLEEDHSLENLYMPKSQLKRLATSKGTSKKIAGYLDQLDQDQQQLQNLSKAFQARTFDETEVEQEVEAEIEAEAVRQIQKPPIVEPLTPRGPHADVIHFARTGRIVDRSAGYERMAHVLARSRTARKHEVITNPLEPRLFVTTEFEQAVKKGFHHPDDFLRPVNWVLFCRKNGLALVVAPQEAEHILDLFCCNEKFMTHLLVYAAPVARKMSSFEDHFYSYPALPEDWTMPAQLKLELGLFAGRLYFSSEEHDALCNYLGFELPDRPFDPSKALFPTTPFNFLQEWLGRRRKGQDFSASPMGRLCQSHRVDVEDTAVEDRDKVDAEMPDAEEEMLSEMHTALGKENEGRKDAGQVDGVNMASLTLSEGGDESSEDAVGGEEEFGGKKDEDEDED